MKVYIKYSLYLLVTALVVVLCVKFDVASKTKGLLEYMETGVDRSTAALLMVCIITLSTPLFMTTTPMNFTCGVIFGVINGSVLMLIGCVLGASIAFLFARYVARDWAMKQLESVPTLIALNNAMKTKGLLMIILSRLSPAFPFAMMSFVFGVTGASFVDHALGTFVGLIPGVLLYSYMGISMKHAASSEAGVDVTLILSVVFSLISIVIISKQAQNIINEMQSEAEKDTQETAKTR